jgi:TonB-linked SusC/RagA family outer membrane protein
MSKLLKWKKNDSSFVLLPHKRIVLKMTALMLFTALIPTQASELESEIQRPHSNQSYEMNTGKQATPQSRKISGVVKDNLGIPIIGANVVVKGTTTGTITDFDGNFSFEIESGSLLTISYIGYVSMDIKLTEKSIYNIVLKEDTQALDEVVVVGYGTQKKANLTGAVSTVKMEDVLGDRPVVSVSQALQGSMPGLQITSSTGKPGGSMDFNIRGTNRLNIDESGAGKPLVLVDNVPMDINMISPSDIETVTVLKDAASSAIYGARAAFGVILITTKRADKGQKTRINYTNNFAFTTPQALIEKASPLETVQFYNDMGYKNGNYGTGQNVADWLGYMKDYEANPGKYPLGYHMDEKGNRYDLREVNHLERMMDDSGFQQSHNISVDGGTEKSSYRVSFGYVDEDGILVTDKDSYNRYNVSTFLNTEITPWLTAQADVKYAKSDITNPNMTSLRAWTPFRLAQLLPSYYPEGDVEVNGEVLPIGTPRWNIENSPLATNTKEDIRIFGKVIVNPLKDLYINAEYTFNRTNVNETEYNKKMKYVNAEKAFFATNSYNGNSLYKMKEKHINYNAINVYANYDKTFGDHQIAAMGGFNQEYSYEQNLWGQKLNVVNPEHPSLSGSSGTQTAGDSYNEFALRGLYYRLSYNYKGKYLVETNGRYDGSSKFPKDNRFGFFPSASVGWRVSEEAFMEWSRSYLDNFKLRGSYGQVGNQAIKNYAYMGVMGTSNAWLENGVWNIARSTPGLFSSDFTWEKVETVDIGFDMGLLNGKLDLVFDWYRRDTKGMLAPGKELPSVLGSSAPLENSADLRTTGWELAVNWRDNINKDWRYNIGINIYDSRSKITKFDNPTGTFGKNNYRVGQEIGEIWGFVTDRFYTEDDFSFIDEANGVYTLKDGVPTIDPFIRDPRPGDILFKDLDGSGTIEATGDNTESNPGDRKIIGNNSRRFPYAISGGIGWKGFDVAVFFQGVGKRDLVIGTNGPSNFLAWPHTNSDNPNAAATVLAHHLDYWTPDNRDAHYPRLGNQSGINQGVDAFNRRTQTKYLMDGSFIKLKNISVSYSFPSKWLEKTKAIKAFKVFFSGEDLWTKHHMYEGMDPEQTMGINDLYPFMKKCSFGINLTL